MSRPSSPSPRPSIPRPPSSSLLSNPTSPKAEGSNQRSGTRRASTPTTPPSLVSKTRARDLLRKHYGLGIGPPPPLTGESKAEDPTDLDSPAFDAKSYYEQLITTSPLPSLLKRENELLSEIKQLDGERQALVYNHHRDLIAASETIASMKAHAESLDTNLDLLKQAFSEISRLFSDVLNPSDTAPEDQQSS